MADWSGGNFAAGKAGQVSEPPGWCGDLSTNLPSGSCTLVVGTQTMCVRFERRMYGFAIFGAFNHRLVNNTRCYEISTVDTRRLPVV